MIMERKKFIWSFDPKIFPLETIFSITQSFVNKAYVMIDGDPNERMVVQMRTKDKSTDLNAIKRDFNIKLKNDLQASGFRVLPNLMEEAEEQPSYLDDPYGIAVPFEKRFGKKAKINEK